MSSIVDRNDYAVLSGSPTTAESKSWEGQARNLKDDAKEQAHQAKTQIKSTAASLQEQVVAGVNKGVQIAKEKAAQLTGKPALADASNEELVAQAEGAAQEGWEEVKRRTNRTVAKGAQQIDDTLDEKLTPAQRAKLNKGVRQAKHAGMRAQVKAKGLVGSVLSSPQLRPIRGFIERNNLQLPVMVLGTILALWLSLSLIRLATTSIAPSVPEFDIHSKEASMNWLKWHAGDYKDRAVDMKDSLSSRAAHFLANHDLDTMKNQAIDWKDIGMKKLGLAEPTWGEWAWSYLTGRPITWKDRVTSVLSLTKTGLATSLASSKGAIQNSINDAKHTLGIHEPSMLERATNWITGRDTSLQARARAEAERQAASLSGRMSGTIDSLKDSVSEGLSNVRAHIPGTAEAKEAALLAQRKAYEATHQSLGSKVASGAEYVKNRIVHGAEEAAHRAEESAKRAVDEAKLKTGL